VPLALANLLLTALVSKLVPAYSLVAAIVFLGVNLVVIVCIALIKYPGWKREKREVVLVPRSASPQAGSS